MAEKDISWAYNDLSDSIRTAFWKTNTFAAYSVQNPGNFNLHVNKAVDKCTTRASEVLLTSFDRVQGDRHIVTATRSTLSSITRRDCQPFNHWTSSPISDHGILTVSSRRHSTSLVAVGTAVTVLQRMSVDMSASVVCTCRFLGGHVDRLSDERSRPVQCLQGVFTRTW